jgi:hypothetical protein
MIKKKNSDKRFLKKDYSLFYKRYFKYAYELIVYHFLFQLYLYHLILKKLNINLTSSIVNFTKH